MSKYFFLTLSLLALGACESFTADRYVSTSGNQAVLKSLSASQKVNVAPFTVATTDSVNVACRLAGPIQVAGSGRHEEYIQKAFVDELQAAGMYRLSSSKIFKAELNKINVSTITPASWTISGDFYANDNFIKAIETQFPYKTSYSAMGACNNAAENFPYAVEQFIGEFVKSSEFKRAVK